MHAADAGVPAAVPLSERIFYLAYHDCVDSTAFLIRHPWLRRLLAPVLVAVWVGLVLYPDPRPLLTSLGRLAQPPLDTAAVAELAQTLPDDAAAVDAFSQGFVPYRTSWDLYGSFWYFPTVAEVVAGKGGDCQAEAVLTASILKAKGIPFTLRYSLAHVWVDYPGKAVSALEDPQTAIASDQGEGWLSGLPRRLPLEETVRERISYHWTPMPLERKLLIYAGVLAGILFAEWPLLRVAWAPGRRSSRLVPPSSPR